MSFLSQPIQDILIGASRKIGGIPLTVVINEATNDTLTVTKQPVQQGSTITDHSFKEPTTFSITAYFKDNSLLSQIAALNPFGSGTAGGLKAIYEQLQELQNSRVPFDIVTPKRIYRNMLMTVLAMTTDKTTEACLAINASFQEAIIVQTVITNVPRRNQKFPGATGKTEPAGRKESFLYKGSNAVTGLFGGG